MSRKDYALLAAAFALAREKIKTVEASPDDLRDGVDYAIDYVMDALKRDNSAFDIERFKKASNYGDQS